MRAASIMGVPPAGGLRLPKGIRFDASAEDQSSKQLNNIGIP
ncbi:hypothetical protein I553_5065 [Mycobacterium xenopi 4042]|uniref:Uncharacterized protein n=1 Tax=Mycobacterium xenopi 4042 TaxID=1299334 RepID=X7ZTR9_MYCXE|nr:hypothetical protein I553_5065 [Mycobacterium xenopi 4042]